MAFPTDRLALERKQQRARVADEMRHVFAEMDSIARRYEAAVQRAAEQHAANRRRLEDERAAVRSQLQSVLAQLDAQSEAHAGNMNRVRAELSEEVVVLEQALAGLRHTR